MDWDYFTVALAVFEILLFKDMTSVILENGRQMYLSSEYATDTMEIRDPRANTNKMTPTPSFHH